MWVVQTRAVSASTAAATRSAGTVTPSSDGTITTSTPRRCLTSHWCTVVGKSRAWTTTFLRLLKSTRLPTMVSPALMLGMMASSAAAAPITRPKAVLIRCVSGNHSSSQASEPFSSQWR